MTTATNGRSGSKAWTMKTSRTGCEKCSSSFTTPSRTPFEVSPWRLDPVTLTLRG